MIRESVLQRTADKAISYIEKYVTLAGAEKREEVLEFFDNMHRVFPQWVIGTCPVMHRDIDYITKNVTHVFGYSMDYMLQHSPMDKFFRHVHEADQEDLHDCFSQMQDYLEGIAPEEHCTYRAVFQFRFLKANGQYIHLHDEKATLRLHQSGNLYYSLFRDITADKTYTGVKMEIYKQGDTLEKIKEYRPATRRNPLSKREEELVTLIRQGLSTKEIAWRLNISQNTVRNTKSKLFEKYNVSNSIELLNMTA